MDGYAVRAQDLQGLPVTLPVSQDIPAGRTDTEPLQSGTAARIMTGAPMPPGADTIVQVERTDGGVRAVRIDSAPGPGVHVRTRGEDVLTGAVVLPAGTVIGPPQVGVAAALGFAELPVRLPTASARAVHRNGTRRTRKTAWPRADLRVQRSDAGRRDHRDRRPRHRRTLRRRRRRSAALGAVRRRRHRHRPDRHLGRSVGWRLRGGEGCAHRPGVEFAKVAMQPGMPQGAGRFAVCRSSPCPAIRSARIVSFEVFLRPAIRAAMGHPDITRPIVRAQLSAAAGLTGRTSGSSVVATWTPSPVPSRPGAGRARICCPGWPARTA